MIPVHLPDDAFYADLARPSEEEPLVIIVSGCISGRFCGYDGSNHGPHNVLKPLLTHPCVKVIAFCPEEYSFGTPRRLCDIQGGTGFDVLDRNARVMTDDGEDWTDGMIKGALKMRELARTNGAKIAVLLDISAACGSQVIYDGNRLRPNPIRVPGQGVAAAALIRDGIKVLSQRDFASLKRVFEFLGLAWIGTEPACDYHESEWYAATFRRAEPAST